MPENGAAKKAVERYLGMADEIWVLYRSQRRVYDLATKGEEAKQMRKNHNQHPSRPSNELDNYDREYIDMPERSEVCSVVVRPLKVIYINMSAAPDANIVKVCNTVEQLVDFLPKRLRLGW